MCVLLHRFGGTGFFTVMAILMGLLLLSGCACGGGATNEGAAGLCHLARQF